MNTAPTGTHDYILPELVDLMFTSVASVVVVGVGLVAAAWMNSAMHGDQVVLAGGGVAAIVTIGRVLIAGAYRRSKPSITSAAQAKVWELRYAIGGAAFTALLGSLSAYVFLIGAPAAQLLIASVMLAYPAGMIVRVAVRPAIARLQLVLTLGPVIGACLFRGEPEMLLMAALLGAYLIAGIEMIGYLHVTITERIMARHELARMALHDDLTRLPNRAHFHKRLHEECKRARRYGERFAVLYLDLDHFKRVNDSMGHAAGDELLRQIARRLQASARASDIVARFSGDEFALMQTPITEKSQTRALAQRLVEVVGAPYMIDEQQVQIGISIGIAICEPPGDEPDALLRRADRELYEAKEAGRGRYSVEDSGEEKRSAPT